MQTLHDRQIRRLLVHRQPQRAVIRAISWANSRASSSFAVLSKAGYFAAAACRAGLSRGRRSEEHTSELQSLMRNSYAVFCLKKKNTNQSTNTSSKIYNIR